MKETNAIPRIAISRSTGRVDSIERITLTPEDRKRISKNAKTNMTFNGNRITFKRATE